MNPTKLTLTTPNGHQIVAYDYQPDSLSQATIVLAPAMGVPQSFYERCAVWLTTAGYRVVTFDYFGLGESAPATLRGLNTTILDWATQDCATVLHHVSQQDSEQEIIWLAHSVGGQLFGAIPNNHLVSRMITVATGSGYWLENAPALKRKAWLLWFFAVPVSLPLFGYFPGKRLRMVGDLPKAVMQQWRRWCLHKDYLIGVEGPELREKFAAVTTPITSFSVTDDELLSARNIESLHSFYRQAPLRMIRIAPADISVKQIGHFGFFRSRFEPTLWRDYLLPELQRGAQRSNRKSA